MPRLTRSVPSPAYAQSLKAIGSRDRALEILITGYRTNPADGELAACRPRAHARQGTHRIATPVLKTAEAQNVRD